MRKTYNFVPGPTPVPDAVNRRMSEPVLSHRSSEFSQLLGRVTEKLKVLFQTQNDVLILTASGTGAMEAAVVNLLSPGDQVIALSSGKFGDRWIELCKTYGVNPTVVTAPWGEAVAPAAVEQVLSSSGQVKVLFATQSETSTGVLHDIEAIGKIARRHGCLFVVDAVSGLGANPLPSDEWGVDVVVTGSQKGLMLPPGLGFISVSQKAWAYVEQAGIPSYYLSLKRAKDSLAKGYTPYTPAVSLLVGLDVALIQICDVGLDTVLAHHARLASATRAGITALGLHVFAQRPSNVLTSVALPHDLDGNALLKVIKSECGVTIANGMEQFRGKVLRIAHLGYDVSPYDVLIALSALEHGLLRLNFPFEPGAGVAAAQRHFLDSL